MKKLTLLLMACSMALLSFGAGGNITYVLNGGITNDHGWTNKNDMYMGLNASWNTFKGTTTTWTSLDALIAANGTAALAVPKGIPTEAAAMDLTFIQNATVKAEWQWLVDFMDAVCTAQKQTLPSSNASYLRYNLSAFFLSSVRTGWPISADYTLAGLPSAFMPTWKHGFAGPSTYDGTAEIMLPDPYREGFTFDGWFEAADFSGVKITSIPAGAEGDKTLYAKWVEYIPTCAEVKVLSAATATKAGGIVTYVNGTTAFIQDATAGLLVEFTEAPSVATGEKIVVDGTTATLGTYIKVTNATLLTKESATIPAYQTLSLATLLADAAPYMFEYVYLEGLTITSYNAGTVTLADDAENAIVLTAAISEESLPVNTKINVKCVVSFDTKIMLLAEAAKVSASPVPRLDPSTYPALEDGKYTLTSKWLVSNKLDNFSANPVGSNSMVRGMTAQNGKMYFVDREHKQLVVVDGANGKKLAPIALASNIFMHNYKDVNGNDSVTAVAGTFQFNDIKQDNTGNILLGNLITSNAQPFQIWKIDLTTGAGVLVIDEILKKNPDFADVSIRFDAFGVYGDVTKNATIMAANANAMEVYKWIITDGVAGPAEVIIIDVTAAGTFVTGLTNPGTAPQVFPLDENYFYLDGNATLPTLIDMEGNVVDGFYNVPKEVEDWSTAIDRRQGHNGLIEFELGGEYFFLIAATNTVGVPPSTFRLLKWADANKLFAGIQSFWTLPADGMGAASNPYRTAVPSVEVNETTGVATIYLYTGENGYGVYELRKVSTSVKDNYNTNAVRITVDGRTLKLDKEVADVTVYSVTGQLVAKANKVSAVDVAGSGVFVVKSTTYDGETAVQKVIVR